MNNTFFRKYLDLLKEADQLSMEDNYQWIPLANEDMGVEESDKTDELDFSPNDTFDEVIEKVMSNEDNRLGTGKYRQGWHHPFDKRLVIKVATPRDNNTTEECAVRNMWEFMVWHKCKNDKLPELELLMPCKAIHPDGLWLTQRKGRRIKADEKVTIKDQVEWIGDRSKGNFARLGDEIKSIDYATTKAMEHLGLPMEYDAAHAAVARLIKQLGLPVTSPNYGKSKPSSDPLDKD